MWQKINSTKFSSMETSPNIQQVVPSKSGPASTNICVSINTFLEWTHIQTHFGLCSKTEFIAFKSVFEFHPNAFCFHILQ